MLLSSCLVFFPWGAESASVAVLGLLSPSLTVCKSVEPECGTECIKINPGLCVLLPNSEMSFSMLEKQL